MKNGCQNLVLASEKIFINRGITLHKFLRAIGFSDMTTLEKINDLADFVRENPDETAYASVDYDDHLMLAEYTLFLNNYMGICVSGEYDEEDCFRQECLIPFFQGNQLTAYTDVTLDRMADKEAYHGVFDDLRAGIGVIFRLQRVVPYLKMRNRGQNIAKSVTVSLAGLSTEGKVLLPIAKSLEEDQKGRKLWRTRLKWMAVAKYGSEEALEFVTLNDMSTAATVEKRLKQKKDVLTIVDSTFYPYGLECDQYLIIADIRDCARVRNPLTGERIWMMTLEVNEMIFDISINAKDLEGEPMIGRRFKGTIWLQGMIHFPK